jgi:hypothetical protein
VCNSALVQVLLSIHTRSCVPTTGLEETSQPTPHWSELSLSLAAAEGDGIRPTCSGVLRAPDERFSARGFETGHAGAGQISTETGNYPSRAPLIGVQLGVAKSNYHQVRRQKELSRKTRQQEKQQKRLAAKSNESTPADGTSDTVAASGDTVSAPIGGTSA